MVLIFVNILFFPHYNINVQKKNFFSKMYEHISNFIQ